MLNVVLYGKTKALFHAEELLKSMVKIENVASFDNFPQVREYFARYDVDMVLLDADDEAVGWQYLADKIWEADKRTKVVLLSCNKEDAVKAYEAGVFDYLLKPVKKKQLERVMAKSE